MHGEGTPNRKGNPPCSRHVRVEVGTEQDEEVGDPADSNDGALGIPSAQETSEMETCMVYLVNKQRTSKIPVGTLTERRGAERGNNIVGLLKLAAMRHNVSLSQMIQINFRGIVAEMEIRVVKGSLTK